MRDPSPNRLIPWAKPTLFGNEERLIREALSSNWISSGPFVERFEAEFAGFLGSKFASATSNGTTALHLAYLALGIQPGDEIIVPGFAFMAAANVALLCGAKPVFADVDAGTCCVTAETIQPKVNARTKAIVAVHTYGNVCPMPEILALGERRNIFVIEDVAEALASECNGRKAGSWGTLGTFSFHAAKTITTGEGGMVVTNNEELHRRMCLYRSCGIARDKRHYWHEVPGHNFRLTNMQAAMGCAQFEHLAAIITRRKQIHACYHKRLERQPGLELQQFPESVAPVLWAMAVKLDLKSFSQGRDGLIQQMREAGIECRPGFYAASQQPLYASGPLPVSDELAGRIVSLPTHLDLTEGDIDLICGKLLEFRQ